MLFIFIMKFLSKKGVWLSHSVLDDPVLQIHYSNLNFEGRKL